MALFGPVFLFSLACNLDTLVLALCFGCQGIRPGWRGCAVLSCVTTLVTALSLVLGNLGGRILPPLLAEKGGGLVLAGMGLWIILNWLHNPELPMQPSCSKKGWLPMSAALALNNAGAGLAAGVTGLHPLWGGAANLAVTLLFLPMGLLLGFRLRSRRLTSLAVPLSGLLLLLLGILEVHL